MKRVFLLVLLAMMFCIPCLAAESSLVFCEGIDAKWQPVNPGAEFKGHTLSWIFRASAGFGEHQLTVSVYRHEGAEEKFVLRKNIDVNPEWDVVGMRNMALPSDGEFTVALTTAAGKTLGKARVKLLKGESATKPAKEETLGTKLQEIYNRYAPK